MCTSRQPQIAPYRTLVQVTYNYYYYYYYHYYSYYSYYYYGL